MLPTDLSDVTPEHFQQFVDDEVVESRTLDYKLLLPDDKADAKKEFLADVSAFANALGGHLIIGVEEADGTPKSFPGVAGASEDELKQRIENLCQSSIEPRLLGVDIRPVRLPSGKFVVVMRIPRSWISPHRVTLGGRGHFYVRDTKGKHPMDTDELRAAFNLSTGLVDRIRSFRGQRVELVARRNSGPVRLEGPPNLMLLLDLVPLTALATSELIDIDGQQKLLRSVLPVTPRMTGSGSMVNLEGHVNYAGTETGAGFPGYVQFFRNGVVEHAACFRVATEHGRVMAGQPIEEHVLEAVSRYLDAQRKLGISLPVYVLLTLYGTKGVKLLRADPIDLMRTDETADRDEIELPEAIVDDFGRELRALLAPTFAIMWNAFGRHRRGSRAGASLARGARG